MPPGFEFLLARRQGHRLCPVAARSIGTDEQPGASIAGSAKLSACAGRRRRHPRADWSWRGRRNLGDRPYDLRRGRRTACAAGPFEIRALSPRADGVLPKTWARLGILSIVAVLPAWACSPNSASARRSGRIAKMARRLGAGDLTGACRAALSRWRTRQPDDGPQPYPPRRSNSSVATSRSSTQNCRRAQELEALEKQRLDVAVNNMAQGLILYDASERVVICNRHNSRK